MRKIIWLFLVLMTVLVTSCTTTRTITEEVPVEVPVVKHDTVRLTSKTSTVVRVKDSVAQKKDTVFFFHREIIDNSSHDTIYIAKKDSASKPIYITKTKTVEKKKSNKDRYLLIIVIISIAFGVTYIVKNKIY